MTTHIAVIGYGYCGPNIVRNFSKVDDTEVTWVCDMNPKVVAEIPHLYPTIHVTNDVTEMLNDDNVDAVVIATPTASHYALAKLALAAGKHVLVEKPMTQTAKEADKLVRFAKKAKKVLMVDHTFIYTPAIRKIKSIIDKGELGEIYYVDSVRTNLGILQKDSNVIFDLATHDFSIMDYLFHQMPLTISATGISHKQLNQETVAHIAAMYKHNLFLHCHVNWLSPEKIRRMIFVGTKKMLTYDDIEPSEKIKIYDKGVSFTKDPKQSYQLRIGYRSGDITSPHIPIEEGLYGMAKEFVKSIQSKKHPITDGEMGVRVIRCITKATESLRSGGKPVSLSFRA